MKQELFPIEKKEVQPLKAFEKKHVEIKLLYHFMTKELNLNASYVFKTLTNNYFLTEKTSYLYNILSDMDNKEENKEWIDRWNPEEASITYRVIMKGHLNRYL